MTDTTTEWIDEQAPPPKVWDHPAKWSALVLGEVCELVEQEQEGVGGSLRVLDPFAGVGRARLQAVLRHLPVTVDGVDLQPEANMGDPGTVVGDATALDPEWTGRFDVVATSPCYGNRMADSHDAKDPCGHCGGLGCDEGCGTCTHTHDGPDAHKVCTSCKGSGLSWRNTYAHSLRRAGGDLVPGSAAGLQWGRAYRGLHEQAMREMVRVVREDGLLVVNMSNHIRNGVEQMVVEWWVNVLTLRGCRLQEVRRVVTPRQRRGANGEARVDGEVVIAVRTPLRRQL